ncbi:hypothetical protein DPMN_039747 [Dreissena polymorpha]|uniref:BACK domain-containing protein n=2 Tax=Dreissena polymorpha TaxID=45954 RepID=A0A9D4CTT3_DREPO|nr:hypothetical protein DPMN_039747 [Dreissena polymorpha]
MSICNKYLSESITGDTVCTIYEQAKFFDMVDLANRCRSFIITNSASVFLEEDFTNLTRESLIDIFSDENLRSSELVHFKAACHWAQTACERRDKDVTPENMRNVLGEALKCIRFPLMSAEDFTKYVSQSDILSAPEQVLLFRHFIMKGFPSKECEFSALPRACTRLVTPVPNLEGDREVKLNQVVIKIEVSHDLHLVSFSMPKQEEIQSVLIVDENDREIPAKVPVFKKDSSSFVFDPPLLLCSKCAQLQVNLNRLTKVRNIYNKSLLTHESQTFFEDLQISHFKVKNRVYNFGEITVWVTMAPAKLKELVFKRGQW